MRCALVDTSQRNHYNFKFFSIVLSLLEHYVVYATFGAMQISTKYDIIVETTIDSRLRAAHFRSPVAGTSKLILRVSHDVVRRMEFGVFLMAHGLGYTHTLAIHSISHFAFLASNRTQKSAHAIETASATHWHALHVLVWLYCSEESLKYMVEKMEMITGCHAVGSQRDCKKCVFLRWCWRRRVCVWFGIANCFISFSPEINKTFERCELNASFYGANKKLYI